MELTNRKPKPNIGDFKTELCFAYLPMWVENKLIWWEYYQTLYKYEYDLNFGCDGWFEIERRLYSSRKM